MRRCLATTLIAAAVLAAPATASAADTVVAPDPAVQQLTALDGTVVWITGSFGDQRLMRRTAGGTIAPVTGAPPSQSYRALDLGRDGDGRLRLTYLRCDRRVPCKAMRDDLRGHRATYRGLAGRGCTVSTAPAQWRTRIAFGQDCTGSAANRRRTGLYVRQGSRTRRLRLPGDAVRFGVNRIESVDIRSTRVAAIAADVYEYAFSQSTSGTGLRSFFAAGSEGDSAEDARGLALGAGNVQWSLTDASHAGDPDVAIIHRFEGDCVQRERLVTPAGAEGFLAIDVAVDERTMYLAVPGLGIVTHVFTPDATPRC